ncbi:MacS family sensor histidine kinase [Rhodococcoides corynebacterioides]|uniref:MacS family sensor histidine kinase n=1 Tax=Rhodococcoides corynebacterioides TaxID=53972 RepID=UPI003ADCA22D
MRSTATPTTDPAGADAPLWRAAAVFRLLTVIYAVGFHLVVHEQYDATRWSHVLVAVVVLWSGVSVVAAVTPSVRPAAVVADQVVTLGLIVSTVAVAGPDWRRDHQVLPTTIWVAGAVVGAALLGGPRVGVASALTMTVAIALVRGTVDADLWRDSTGPILVSVGLALGLAARIARSARARLDEAIALAAATAERERLAREVHDGVLQVLALVNRRGRELGGPAAELGTLAAEQERALRDLLSGNSSRVPGALGDGSRVDLTTDVRAAVGPTVTVAAPSDPVSVAADVGREVVAAVVAAVDNAHRHAPGAAIYVSIEDDAGTVVVGVRDDGPGVDPARLVAARAEGRLGVAASIVGRLESLGGRAELISAPGEGTEWELTVPNP